MHPVHATWTARDRLFFWSHRALDDGGVITDCPVLDGVESDAVERVLVFPGARVQRRPVVGREASIADLVPALASIPRGARLSDSIRCWSRAALLALELAYHQRVVPTVSDGEARWEALLSRPGDKERFHRLAAALPPVSFSVPTRSAGPIRLQRREVVLQAFLDAAVDGLYRQGAHAGAARGWVFQFAQSLRGDEAVFSPRDARFQGITEKIVAWSSQAHATGLRVGLELLLPSREGEDFGLSLTLHPDDVVGEPIPIHQAWEAGALMTLDGQRYPHPALGALRGIARAIRMFPPLQASLAGSRPRDLRWTAREAWQFLDQGVDLLREAGFVVNVPAEFEVAGRQRIRARMCIDAATRADGSVDLDGLLSFRWEVVLGDSVIDGSVFAGLVERGEPLVRFRDEWVLLDPAEVAKLPEGLPQDGRIPATDALRAVLTGELDGVPVVADGRMALLVETLRSPPPQPVSTRFVGALRPYQEDGLSWLSTLGRLGLGACLADDMGLGKTIQLIAHLLGRHRDGGPPSLVVCPASVLGNWVRELQRFAPDLRVLRYHGLHREAGQLEDFDVVLTTYGLMVRDQDELAAVEWDVVALDEAQAIKNPIAHRARAALTLTAHHRVALTGTPVENRLDELWSIMEFLVPGLLGPRAAFQRHVAVPVERFGDEETARRLRLGISPFLLRRLKSDPSVIADLPEKLEHREYCTLTPEQARLYQLVVDESMERIASAQDIERRGLVLAMLTALKQVCNHPAHYLADGGALEGRSGKLERTVDLLESIFTAGERALVFTQYRVMGELLQRYLGELVGEDLPFLHGGTPLARREQMVQAFQEDDDAPPLLLVSLRAGGTGLNLTRATHVIHYDRWWNPAVEDQATDRAYRIGQRRDVQVHKLVCQETLEERIDAMLEDKRALADQIVGSSERWVTELGDDELRRLVALGDDAVMEE